MSLGLSASGFRFNAAVELDAHASASYALNHSTVSVHSVDLREMLVNDNAKSSFRFLEKPGLLCGGPPCQGFSEINRHRSLTDPRNSLVDVYFCAVEKLRPRVVLMENVTGILTLDNGRAFRSLVDNLTGIGYTVSVGILQAGSFGLPQNRWRVFLVGIVQPERAFEWPTPTHKFHSTNFVGMPAWRNHVIDSRIRRPFEDELLPPITVFEAIGDLPWETVADPDVPVQMRTAHPTPSLFNSTTNKNASIFDHASFKMEPISLKRCELIPQGGGWLNLPDELQPGNLKRYSKRKGSFDNRWGRLSWDGQFPTIVTKPEPYWGRYLHPVANRVISIRECARAQGFPDWFRFSGPISSRYRQIGNAVPPPIARLIGAQIMAALQSS